MRERQCKLVSTNRPRVVKKYVEEAVKEEESIGKRTRKMVVNPFLRKIRSRGVKEEQEMENEQI